MIKKIFLAVGFLWLFLLINMIAVSAAPSFDQTNLSKGLLSVTYDGALTKTIKLSVEKAGSKDPYNYNITSNKAFSVPITTGNGEYTAKILENVSGNSYRVVAKDSFTVNITEPNDMFIPASPIVNFTSENNAIKGYASIMKGTQTEKVKVMYEKTVQDYVYDYEKAATIPAGYVPSIDEIYKIKKAICYDYAVMLASNLRNQKIPVKLVMGYAPEIKEYHAWNEIYYDGKWVVVDTTYDSAYAKAGQKYNMEKDASLFKPVKIY